MASKNGTNSSQREWKLFPEPGYEQVDEQDLARELLQIQGYGERLGYGVIVTPIRVKADDGTFFNGGYVFRAMTVPAISEQEYAAMRGLVLPADFNFEDPATEDGDEELIATDGASGTSGEG